MYGENLSHHRHHSIVSIIGMVTIDVTIIVTIIVVATVVSPKRSHHRHHYIVSDQLIVTSVSAKTMASTLTMMVMMTMATKTTRIATVMAIMITTVFTMAMMMMMMVNMMIMTTAKIIIMNLRNRTGEERKQPTLCDRRDNIFVQ